MLHRVGALIGASYPDFHRVAHVLAGYLFDELRHGGREEQRLSCLGRLVEDGFEVVFEAHVEHLVGLVEHQPADVAYLEAALAQHVADASRGAHHYVRALLQGLHLRAHVAAAVDGHYADALLVFGEGRQVFGYLQAELAGGADDDGLGVGAVGVGQLHYGQAEGARLAGAGLRQRDDVLTVVENFRNRAFLDGRGRFEPKLFDGLQYVFGKACF